MSRHRPPAANAGEYLWLLFWLLVIGAAQLFVSTLRAIGLVTGLVILYIVGRALLKAMGGP